MAACEEPGDPPVGLHRFAERGGQVFRDLLEPNAPVEFLELGDTLQHED